MRPGATLAAALLLLAGHGAAHAEPECAFDPPSPTLKARAYPGQTQVRQSGNRLREDAQLGPGLHLEIRHSGCVDAVVVEYGLTVPSKDRSDDALIDLARAALAGLKTNEPAGWQNELLDFLKRAHKIPPQNAVRALCRDGTVGAEICSWDSGGGYTVAVQRTGQATRVVITEYFSG